MASRPDLDPRWRIFDHLPRKQRIEALKAHKAEIAAIETRERALELGPPSARRAHVMTLAERRAGLRPGQ
jgi:hypothetical protein